MSQFTDELRDQVNKGLEELKTLRDDIRVRVHLAGMEAKSRWNDELEPRFHAMEGQLREVGDRVEEAARKALADVIDTFKGFRDSLSKDEKAEKDAPKDPPAQQS